VGRSRCRTQAGGAAPRALTAAAAAVVSLLVGCGDTARPVITVSPRDGLADSPLRIKVGDAPKGAVVRATATDAEGGRYQSTTPAAAAIREPWRPIVTMRGGSGSFAALLPALRVRLDVMDGDRSVASTTVTRRFVADGVRARPVRDGLYGRLYEPSDTTKETGVLVIGGSDGGLRTEHIAALLASHGHRAMALAYFGASGLPKELERIRLEYFERAARRLHARRIALLGISRGGEAALLIGATYPKLIDGVVALVPSNVVNSALDRRSPAWTLRGRPVPFAEVFGDPEAFGDPDAIIRAERINGPVLTVSAGRDGLWPSAAYAKALHDRLDQRHFAHPHRDISIVDAGHGIGSAVPSIPKPASPELGGSQQADETGRERAWPEILRFLDGL
jgi:dienelactone hydrolase